MEKNLVEKNLVEKLAAQIDFEDIAERWVEAQYEGHCIANNLDMEESALDAFLAEYITEFTKGEGNIGGFQFGCDIEDDLDKEQLKIYRNLTGEERLEIRGLFERAVVVEVFKRADFDENKFSSKNALAKKVCKKLELNFEIGFVEAFQPKGKNRNIYVRGAFAANIRDFKYLKNVCEEEGYVFTGFQG